MATTTQDGDVFLDGVITQKTGSANDDSVAGGIVHVNTTTASNVASASDTTLATYTVPANLLAVNDQSIYFEAVGKIAINGQPNAAVTFKVSFGGTNIYTYSIPTVSQTYFILRGRILRIGASSQKCYVSLFAGSGGGAGMFFKTDYTATAINLAVANNLIITGQSTAVDFATLYALVVRFEGANS